MPKNNLLLVTFLCITVQSFSKDMIKKEIPLTFSKAVISLKATLKQKNLTVFATIDHQKAATTAGLKMNPAIVFIFGNPAVGTTLMNENMALSYNLPLKIAIYQDANGKVWAQSRKLPTDKASVEQTKRIKKLNTILQELLNIK